MELRQGRKEGREEGRTGGRKEGRPVEAIDWLEEEEEERAGEDGYVSRSG